MPEGDFRISLGKRPRTCPSIRCLGVKTGWEDYSDEDREALREAEQVFYPGPLFEDLFLSLGKKVFPRNACAFIGNKIRQTALFELLGISHPRTRLYYGRRRVERILEDFTPPFVAKTPVGSSMGKGVWLIRHPGELECYLAEHHPAYIQEYLPIDRDLRTVLIRGQVVHAYWRIGQPGSFHNNVSQGAHISFDHIPEEAIAFAEHVARACRFDEVALDICHARGRHFVIEANISYGVEGFRRAGLDIYEVLAQLDRKGEL